MFDPQDFLNLSKQLLPVSTVFEEAKTRTIISRVYYASFLVAREDFRENLRGEIKQIYNKLCDDPKAGGVLHELIIRLVKKIDLGIGDTLHNLRRQRNLADYNLRVSLSLREARKATNEAEGFLYDLPAIIQRIPSFHHELGNVIYEVASRIYRRRRDYYLV